MNRAFFVCGPESSGNSFMVSLLCDTGCAGAGKIDKPIDGPPPHYPLAKREPLPELLAFYRSFPHTAHVSHPANRQFYSGISDG